MRRQLRGQPGTGYGLNWAAWHHLIGPFATLDRAVRFLLGGSSAPIPGSM
jgi:hypothetical protein